MFIVTVKYYSTRLSSANFPVHLLPNVKPPGCIAGQLQVSWLGVIPSGTVVGVAMGDLPCATMSAVKQPGDAGNGE